MGGGDDPVEEVREAVALLGHEIRLDIVLATLENWRGVHTEPQSYSELMRAVGLEDSGKFNYHLSKLRGRYVRKVEDGYAPTASATALYRAVLANRPSAGPDRAAFDVGAACPECGGDLGATYEREFLTVRCRDCGSLAGDFTYPFPRNGLAGRTDREIVDAVCRRAAHHVELARSGQCPFCAGATTAVVREDLDDDATHDVEITCDTCRFVVGVGILFAVALAPAVTAALVALSAPLGDVRNWELPEPTTRIRSRDPLELELAVETDGGTATIIVDGDLDVRRVTVDGEPVGER